MTATILRHLFLVASVGLWLHGCSELAPRVQPSSERIVPAAGKALIVFIRPPMDVTILDYGRAPVFKVNGGDSEGNGADLEILGLLPVKTKLAYQADPGKYLFMSVGKNADFIAAEVLPDRTYYISILARSGVYPLKPADRQEQGSDEFRERLASAKWTTKGPDALTYAASRMTEIRARHIAGYRIWAQKGAAENPRLLPEHGATQAQ